MHDPRDAAASQVDTVASPEERGHHNSNQGAHNVEELDVDHSVQ
jgi:hypothetical protein